MVKDKKVIHDPVILITGGTGFAGSHLVEYLQKIGEKNIHVTSHSGKTGFVSKVWEDKDIQKEWGFEITPDNTHIFLCGHPLMITGMVEILEKDGFTEHSRKNPGTIHLEKFW